MFSSFTHQYFVHFTQSICSYDGSICPPSPRLNSYSQPNNHGRHSITHNRNFTSVENEHQLRSLNYIDSGGGSGGGSGDDNDIDNQPNYRGHNGYRDRFSEREQTHLATKRTSQRKMADLNIARGHSPHFSPSRNNGKSQKMRNRVLLAPATVFNVWKLCISIWIAATADVQTLHVHLPNHGFRMIRFDEASDVSQIINLIVASMSTGQKANTQNYALRLRHMLTKDVSFNFGHIHIPFSWYRIFDFNHSFYTLCAAVGGLLFTV